MHKRSSGRLFFLPFGLLRVHCGQSKAQSDISELKASELVQGALRAYLGYVTGVIGVFGYDWQEDPT